MGQDARHLVEDFLGEADRALPEGYQAVIYGSAARGHWDAAVSDVNLLLIADPMGAAELRELGPALRALPAEWRSPPLLLTPEEWSRAGDVFPIEMTDMLQAREVLRGTDPLAGMQPHPSHLRVALERELRTRVVRLRQGFALAAADSAALGALARGTLGSVLAMARGTLVLLGRPVPDDTVQVLRAFAEVTGAPAAPFLEIGGHWRHPEWHCPADLFEQYLGSLARAVEYVDHHVPGAR